MQSHDCEVVGRPPPKTGPLVFLGNSVAAALGRVRAVVQSTACRASRKVLGQCSLYDHELFCTHCHRNEPLLKPVFAQSLSGLCFAA